MASYEKITNVSFAQDDQIKDNDALFIHIKNDSEQINGLRQIKISDLRNKFGALYELLENKISVIPEIAADENKYPTANAVRAYVASHSGGGGGGSSSADLIIYDNTKSGLLSINVQDAIDEINSKTSQVIFKHWEEND